MILFLLFATGVIDTGGKFAADVVDTTAICHGEFAAGIVVTGDNFLLVSTTPAVPVANCHRCS